MSLKFFQQNGPNKIKGKPSGIAFEEDALLTATAPGSELLKVSHRARIFKGTQAALHVSVVVASNLSWDKDLFTFLHL